MRDSHLVNAPEGVELELSLAGPFSRAWAGFLDLLLQLLVVLALALGMAAMGLGAELDSLGVALLIGVTFLVFWGYGVFWELLWQGRTPGKWATGLCVLRQDGLPIGARESLLRNLCRIVDMMPVPAYGVAFVTTLIDPLNRRLGDLVAGTIVVRDRAPAAAASQAGAAWAVRAERGQARAALALPGGTLSARQLAVVEQFLERRQRLEPERRQQLAGQLTAPLRPLLGPELSELLDRPGGWGSERVLERIWELAQAGPTRPVADRRTRKGLF